MKNIFNDIKTNYLNYLLIAITFAFGFYLSSGIFLFGNNPERALKGWELAVVLWSVITCFIY